MALDTPASNLFFQVISSRHDAELGTIATTNLPFGKFNQIFANDAIAHAIVDRLVNEAEVFYMEGDSYRPHQRQEKLKRKDNMTDVTTKLAWEFAKTNGKAILKRMSADDVVANTEIEVMNSFQSYAEIIAQVQAKKKK